MTDFHDPRWQFSVGFDPDTLREEGHESTTLAGHTHENGTNVAEFLRTCTQEDLLQIANDCIASDNFWKHYWNTIIVATLDRITENGANK